jgi:hypothetical protein
MMHGAAYYFDAISYRLRRNPVLTAMMVCSLVFGVSALIAGVKVWRVSSACTIAQMSAPPIVVQDVTYIASRSDLLMHEALQTACPCAASSKWHWQPI